MKNLWIGLLGLTSASFWYGCSTQTAGNTTETTNTISAVVLDKDGETLVENPVLLRRFSDTSSVLVEELIVDTDSMGQILEEVDPGIWTLEAYNRDSTQAVVLSQQVKDSTDLGVIKLKPTMSFSGNITELNDVNWEIVRLQENQRSAVLNGDGNFSFSQLPRGKYEIRVETEDEVKLDTIDLTYAPDNLVIEWTPGEKPMFKSEDSSLAEIRAYWSFDSTVADFYPDSIVPTISGNIEYMMPGIKNQSANFIAATSLNFGSQEDKLNIARDEDFGMSLWFKLQANELQSKFGLLNYQPTAPERHGFDLVIDAEKKMAFLIEVEYAGVVDTLVKTKFDFKYDEWHHLAFYRIETLYGLELDRSYKEQRFAAEASSFEKSWFIIGADHLFQFFLRNELDELILFKEMPSEQQLDSLYTIGK